MMQTQNLTQDQISARTIDSAEDCVDAVLRMLQFGSADAPLFRIHHKDLSMAVALKRLGFNLFTLLRHPIRRAISAYYYHRNVTKRMANRPEHMPEAYLSSMLREENIIKTALGQTPVWSFTCSWDNCKYRFCEGLAPRDNNAPLTAADAEKTIKALDTLFDVVGCGDTGMDSMQTLIQKAYGWSTYTIGRLNVHNDTHAPGGVTTPTRMRELAKRTLEFRVFEHYCGAQEETWMPYTLQDDKPSFETRRDAVPLDRGSRRHFAPGARGQQP